MNRRYVVIHGSFVFEAAQDVGVSATYRPLDIITNTG